MPLWGVDENNIHLHIGLKRTPFEGIKLFRNFTRTSEKVKFISGMAVVLQMLWPFWVHGGVFACLVDVRFGKI